MVELMTSPHPMYRIFAFNIFRELCLAALSAYNDMTPDCSKPLSCLDAFSATGKSCIFS